MQQALVVCLSCGAFSTRRAASAHGDAMQRARALCPHCDTEAVVTLTPPAPDPYIGLLKEL